MQFREIKKDETLLILQRNYDETSQKYQLVILSERNYTIRPYVLNDSYMMLYDLIFDETNGTIVGARPHFVYRDIIYCSNEKLNKQTFNVRRPALFIEQDGSILYYIDYNDFKYTINLCFTDAVDSSQIDRSGETKDKSENVWIYVGVPKDGMVPVYTSRVYDGKFTGRHLKNMHEIKYHLYKCVETSPYNRESLSIFREAISQR